MLLALSMGRITVAALCGLAILASLALWFALRPPVLAHPNLPPVMRRGAYWWLAATLFFAAAAIAWQLLKQPLGLPRSGIYRFVVLALGLTPVLVVNPIYLWRTAWLRRAVKAADGRLCRHCAFDLNGLPANGSCPECGNTYDTEADRALWLSSGPAST